MLNAIFRSIFGTKHERDVKRMRPGGRRDRRARAGRCRRSPTRPCAPAPTELRQRLADGAEVDDLLPEAFAAVREAARRTVRMRHFDVQMMGGMVLHSGKIAEMATGEGKTLVATLPAYLNALPGLGTHVVTVNDYLARRDAQWMGPIYHALGLTVGVIQHEMQYLYDPAYASSDIRLAALRPVTRKEAYARRHHLRHQQRVRLRLPPRQHAVQPRRHRPARAPLRDRGRGGLDPDRRGADPAHHLGARPQRGEPGPALREGEPGDPAAQARRHHRGGQALGDRGVGRGRLHRGREGAHRLAHRPGRGLLRAAARHREPLRARQHRDRPPHPPGAEGPPHLPQGRGLRGQGPGDGGRPGPDGHAGAGGDRGRVHRPHDAGPALVRRPARGGGGQGRPQDRAGEPDPRHHHAAELLPHVRQALGHDRAPRPPRRRSSPRSTSSTSR